MFNSCLVTHGHDEMSNMLCFLKNKEPTEFTHTGGFLNAVIPEVWKDGRMDGKTIEPDKLQWLQLPVFAACESWRQLQWSNLAKWLVQQR